MQFRGHTLRDESPDFKRFFKKYFPLLYLFAKKLTKNESLSKDIVQEAFIKTWRSTNNFENENTLKAYLYLVTKSLCVDYWRKNKLINKEVHESYIEETYLDEIVKQETYHLLNMAIERLPVQQKNIVELTLRGLKNTEIAIDLDISLNTVKTHKQKAYKNIRKAIIPLLATFIIAVLIIFY